MSGAFFGLTPALSKGEGARTAEVGDFVEWVLFTTRRDSCESWELDELDFLDC